MQQTLQAKFLATAIPAALLLMHFVGQIMGQMF
jgi:hypothetical protein